MASLIYIMGTIIKLTGNKSIQQLWNNLAAYIAQIKGTRNADSSVGDVAAELELAASKWAECEDNLTTANSRRTNCNLRWRKPNKRQAML